MKYDTFISYRRETGFLMAQVIHDKLVQRGLNCFMDLEELRSGSFNEELYNVIDSSDNFILILSKNALDRCISKDDWVRKEILRAIVKNKNIIPIWCDEFAWPKDKNEYFTKKMQALEFRTAVRSSQEYLDAMIDKIIEFMVGINQPSSQNSYIERSSGGVAEFMSSAIGSVEKVREINMFFRAGSEWHQNSALVDILINAVNEKIPVKVIVNEKETVEHLAAHMRQPMKEYVGYDNSLKVWLKKAELYPDCIQVRIADIPLMHRYYCVKGEDFGMAKTVLYSYGNYDTKKNFQCVFNSDCSEYSLFENEFNYIWENASHKG